MQHYKQVFVLYSVVLWYSSTNKYLYYIRWSGGAQYKHVVVLHAVVSRYSSTNMYYMCSVVGLVWLYKQHLCYIQWSTGTLAQTSFSYIQYSFSTAVQIISLHSMYFFIFSGPLARQYKQLLSRGHRNNRAQVASPRKPSKDR